MRSGSSKIDENAWVCVSIVVIGMSLVNVLCDVKVWIAAAIVSALALGFDSPHAATILMVVLMAQMAVSLDGINFSKDDFSTHRKGITMCLLACFGINTGLTLVTGLFFIGDEQLWTGWVMLASMPCAVSVVVSALIMKGDAKLSVLSLTAIYVIAMGLTPLITKVMLGNAVDPLEILKYIVLFIAIPFGLSFVVRRLNLSSPVKSIFINAMMFGMVFIGLASRRDFILSDTYIVGLLIIACVVRTFVVSLVLVYLFRRTGVKREDGVVYMTMGVWKNSGMSISMTMALFATTMPDAVLPCAVSLVIEASWFAVMSKLIERFWPQGSDTRSGTSIAIE